MAISHTRTWNAQYEALPPDVEHVRYGAERSRELKVDIQERVTLEHLFGGTDANANQGWHRSGALVSYIQDTAPTLLPDGVTALADDTFSKGRLWLDTDDGWLYYWDGAAWSVCEEARVELVLEIGIWNMDMYASKHVLHGLGNAWKGVRTVTGIIRDDVDVGYYMIPSTNNSNGGLALWASAVNSNAVVLYRLGGGFSTLAFAKTTGSYNRGWLHLKYEA